MRRLLLSLGLLCASIAAADTLPPPTLINTNLTAGGSCSVTASYINQLNGRTYACLAGVLREINLPTAPALTCASDGYVLTWVLANVRYECLAPSGGGGGGTPAGSGTEVQFRNGSSFGATTGFDWTSGSRLLRLGAAGTEGAIRLPSLDTAFFHVKGTSSILNAQRDNLLRIGWNADQEDPTEPQWLVAQLETHYFDTTSPASHVGELHLGAYTSTLGVGRRPIQINVFRQDNADATWLANQVQLVFSGNAYFKNSASTSGIFDVLGDSNSILVHSGTTFASDANNTAWLKQKNNAGVYKSLALLDSGNVWRLAPDGESSRFLGNVYAGNSTSDYALKVDLSARKLTVGSGDSVDSGIRIVGGTASHAQGVTVGDGTNEYTLSRNASTSALDFTGTQGGKSYTFDAGMTVTGTVAATTFTGAYGAAGLTGSIADARLSANVPLLNAANTFTGGLMSVTSNAVNAKLKLDHSTNGNGFGSQIQFSGGGSDHFFMGTNRTGGAYYMDLENSSGTKVWNVPESTLNFIVGVNANTDTNAAKMQVQDGVQWIYSAARPTCDSTHRGVVWYVAGGGGVADTFEVCYKNSADVYGWSQLDATGAVLTSAANVFTAPQQVSAALGSELAPALTAGNWTVGSGWESPIVGPGLIKNSDGVGTQTPSAATNIVANTVYRLSITVSALSVGTATYTLGAIAGNLTLSAAATYVDYITTTNTSKLIITPSSTSRFTISAISIKVITGGTGNLTVDSCMAIGQPFCDNATQPELVINQPVAGGNAIRVNKNGVQQFRVSGIDGLISTNGSINFSTFDRTVGVGTTANRIQFPNGLVDIYQANNTLALSLSNTLYTINPATKFTSTVSTYNNIATAGKGLPSIYGSVALTGQASSIGTTNIQCGGAVCPAGLYRVIVEMVATTAGSSGTVATTVGWNDGTASRTSSPASIVTFGTTARSAGAEYLTADGVNNITYSTTVTSPIGSPAYSLKVTLESLQ